MEILILIGTQTGNTEHVAHEVASSLASKSVIFQLVDFLDAYPEMLQDYQFAILATSTWGDGELPDNALDFFDALMQLRPTLDHLSFGVLALGDHVYDPHFCSAGKTLADAFTDLGATKLIEPFEIDAGPTLDDLRAAREWASALLAKFSEQA